ncbi:MAG: type II toxin-antitoxin system Phd/YefM family antitoxin [Desulfuromonadaceae bacterium]|nr:type II toxin-antitoxin system Phd/YefM family antitoxin [Desulfuromonadaceae bacterium]
MNLNKDIKPVSYFKSHAADILKQVNETHRPVIITQNGEARAVLQDPESYQAMKNAFSVIKLISQGEEDIRQGEILPQEEVFAGLEEKLADR